jgi:hypothetical protein
MPGSPKWSPSFRFQQMPLFYWYACLLICLLHFSAVSYFQDPDKVKYVLVNMCVWYLEIAIFHNAWTE